MVLKNVRKSKSGCHGEKERDRMSPYPSRWFGLPCLCAWALSVLSVSVSQLLFWGNSPLFSFVHIITVQRRIEWERKAIIRIFFQKKHFLCWLLISYQPCRLLAWGNANIFLSFAYIYTARGSNVTLYKPGVSFAVARLPSPTSSPPAIWMSNSWHLFSSRWLWHTPTPAFKYRRNIYAYRKGHGHHLISWSWTGTSLHQVNGKMTRRERVSCPVDRRGTRHWKGGFSRKSRSSPISFYIKGRFSSKLTSDSWQALRSFVTCHKTASGLDVLEHS